MSTITKTLVLAGAGTGKTTYLTNQLREHENHLLCSFSRAAAKVARARGIQASTLHAICYKALHHSYKIATKTEALVLLRKFVGFKKGKEYYYILSLTQYLGQALVKKGIITLSPHVILTGEQPKIDLDDIYEFIHALRKAKLMTFDLMPLYILMSEELIEDAVILSGLTGVTALAIDECQDTSMPMLHFINALSESIPRLEELICVGDFKQAIYEVNGSRIETFSDWVAGHSDFKIVNLDVNYRSNQEIVDYANQIELNSIPQEYNIQMTSARGSGGIVQYMRVPDILTFLQQEQGKVYWLCNSNSEVTGVVNLLTNSGIPCIGTVARAYRDKLQVLSQQAIGFFWKNIGNAAACELLLNPLYNDSIKNRSHFISCLRKLLFLEVWRSGSPDIDMLIDKANLFKHQALKVSMNQDLDAIFDLEYVSRFFGENLTLRSFCASNFEFSCEEQFQGNYILPKSIEDFVERNKSKSVKSLLSYFAFGSSPDKKEEDYLGVVVSTIHNAKGRESDVCIIPSACSSDRTHYVAATRAKSRLIIAQQGEEGER